MWKSKVYGGCVIGPVGDAGKGSARTRDNVISDQVGLYQIEHVFGGGYYALENLHIRDPENYKNLIPKTNV